MRKPVVGEEMIVAVRVARDSRPHVCTVIQANEFYFSVTVNNRTMCFKTRTREHLYGNKHRIYNNRAEYDAEKKHGLKCKIRIGATDKHTLGNLQLSDLITIAKLLDNAGTNKALKTNTDRQNMGDDKGC